MRMDVEQVERKYGAIRTKKQKNKKKLTPRISPPEKSDDRCCLCRLTTRLKRSLRFVKVTEEMERKDTKPY